VFFFFIGLDLTADLSQRSAPSGTKTEGVELRTTERQKNITQRRRVLTDQKKGHVIPVKTGIQYFSEKDGKG